MCLRRLFKTVMLMGLGAILGTVVFELLLRGMEMGPLWRIMPVAEAGLYGPDRDAGYTLRPGASGIWLQESRARALVNAHGMLDRDYGAEKPAGTSRVAFFGNSVVEALQVDRAATFVRLIEPLFARAPRRVEAMNFGIAGATPAVMAARFESRAVPLKPDLAVFIVSPAEFASPGFFDDTSFAGYTAGKGGEIARTAGFRGGPGYKLRSGPIGGLLYALIDHLRVARVLNARMNAGLFDEVGSDTQPGAASCGEASTPVTNISGRAGQAAEAFISDIARVGRAAGIKVLVLVSADIGPCSGGGEANAAATRQIAAIGARHGVTVADLYAALRSHLGGGANILDLHGFGLHRGGGHLNHAGHAAYAKALAPLIRRQLQPN